MLFTSQQLSDELGVSERTIRRNTKKAIDNNIEAVALGRDTFSISKQTGIGGRGWIYNYKRIAKQAAKPKRKVCPHLALNPADLPHFNNLNKPTKDEKLAIIRFYNTSQHPLGHIVKALIMSHGAQIKPESLLAKIKRWNKAFKTQGASALEDKRGGKAFKADLALVEQAIMGGGNLHTTTLFGFYCHLYAKHHDIAINYQKPTADISQSAFERSVKHLLKTKPLLKEYLKIGMDAFIYSEPSFGREWEYPNQQWEVDATPLDIMCKVPHVDGFRDYQTRDKNSDYHLTRPQLIRIIDNFSGASVCGLYESSNSYANIRLIYKALGKLGRPETIKGDNGADYVSEHMQTVLADLGINYVATGKARGDEKGTIEGSFRVLQHSKEFEALPGFMGHNVQQRQKLEAQASTKLEKLSGVQTNIKGDFMWWWEVENWVDNYLAFKDLNKYQSHTAESQEIMQTVYRQIGKKINKKVSKEGIRHLNEHYVSFDMWDSINIGDNVDVIEHIDDSKILFLYQKDGQYIGEIKDKNIFRQETGYTVEELKTNKKQYKQRVVNDVKRLTKQAQKNFKGYQNEIRDEYLDEEIAQVTKQQKDDKKQNETGGDAMAQYIKLAQV